MSLRKGMKVRIVTEEPFLSEIKNEVGTVHEIYEDMGVAIVKIPGGAAKVPIEFLEEVKEENPTDQKPGTRRITKEAFEAAIDKVTKPSPEKMADEHGFLYMPTRLAAKATGHVIMDDLFKNNSEVDLTEDELVGLLWDKCSPSNVASRMKNPWTDPKYPEVSLKKVTLISSSSFTYLEDIVDLLFPDKEINNA